MPAETHVERGSFGPGEVLVLIRERIADILEIDEASVTRDSRFVEDLAADSLVLIELVESLEDELGERTVGFSFDDEDLPDLHTVGDAVDYVLARMSVAGRDMTHSEDLERFETALGYRFDDRGHLAAALVHRSYCAEHADAESNERMEFLGDAVLGLSVTDHVYIEYPELPEGELAKLRASVVNADALAELAEALDLGAVLLLGKGEDASGGRAKPSILSDAMEAVIAAVYLDGGWVAADELVLRLLSERIREGALGPGGHDFKTRLQELAAQRIDQLPKYQVRSDGPDHSKRFYATVTLRGENYGEGEGRSKKQAEQSAARMAWDRLEAEGDAPALAHSGTGEPPDA